MASVCSICTSVSAPPSEPFGGFHKQVGAVAPFLCRPSGVGSRLHAPGASGVRFRAHALHAPHEISASLFQWVRVVEALYRLLVFLPAVRGQLYRPPQLLRAVPEDAEQVHDVAVEVVDRLYPARVLVEEHGGAAGEGFQVAELFVPVWEVLYNPLCYAPLGARVSKHRPHSTSAQSSSYQ